jgi:UDP-3-O-[3-hydroxymyristoyl] glucosamine N-acyltransferase
MIVADIAKHVNGVVIGDENAEINSLCKIDQSFSGGLTFLANSKYEAHLKTTEATAIFVKEEYSGTKATLIKVKDPYLAFVQSIKYFYQLPDSVDDGIHATSVIDKSAKVGKNVKISAHVFIGKNTIISDNVIIHPNTTILEDCFIGESSRIYSNVSIRESSFIGKYVTIHNGAVIGSDGFGFAPDPPNGFEKIPQTGTVRIKDNVEIGANTVIDRATIGETVIEEGTKLDNLIQIAHNVHIGQHNVFAAQTGIAGSTEIGNWNQFGGQTAINGHIKIGDQNKIGAKSGISNSVGNNEILFGIPAISLNEFKRINASLKRLPELVKNNRFVKKLMEKEKT